MINETIDTLLTKVKDLARTSTVVGDPIKVGDVTIVPVSKVSVGFGTGNIQNNSSKNSEGATGGFTITPIAMISIYEGESKLLLLDKKDQSIEKMLDLVPNILDRFAPKKTQSKES